MAEVEPHDEVADWLATLTDAEWERVVVIVHRPADLGSQARMPLPRSLGDGLFELRFTLGPTARRITNRFTKGGRIILPTTLAQTTRQRTQRDRPSTQGSRRECALRYP